MPKIMTQPDEVFQIVRFSRSEIEALNLDEVKQACWLKFSPDSERLIEHNVPCEIAAEILLEIALDYYRKNSCDKWRCECASITAGKASGWQERKTLLLPQRTPRRELVRRAKAAYGWTGQRCKVYCSGNIIEVHRAKPYLVLRLVQHD